MSDAPAIYKLMPQVIRDIGAIPKTNRNKAQNYRFRSIDDVLNAIHPVLVKHGVATSFEVTQYKTEVSTRQVPGKSGLVYRATLLMRVSFWAEDGSSIESTAAGEGLDFGSDKATNKAMSAAFKYACFFGLAIPFVDAEDSDTSSAPTQKPIAETNTAATVPTTSQELMAKVLADTPSVKASEAAAKELATLAQRRAVEDLFKQLVLTREQVAGILAKRNVKWLKELTSYQAAELISNMTKKRDAQMVNPT